MDIIDCFCFPQRYASEADLFSQVPDSHFLQDKRIAKTAYFPLFHNDITCCDAFIESCNNSNRFGCYGLLPLEEAALDAFFQRTHLMAGFALHPYLQGLTEQQADRHCVNIRQRCGRMLPIFISTAIGSARLYDIAPLKIAQRIAAQYDGPVILTHGGGMKVLEALLIADSFPNVYLDTSFSLSYWLGSSVEQDFAFAMRKLGTHRWLYGSDAPFIAESVAVEQHMAFFYRYGFSDTDVENIMGKTALELLEKTEVIGHANTF
jgi:predicted TIM-barrel fold metal-dependent hydrolase